MQQEQSDEPSTISFWQHGKSNKSHAKKVDYDILKLLGLLTRLVEKYGIKEVVLKLESLM